MYVCTKEKTTTTKFSVYVVCRSLQYHYYHRHRHHHLFAIIPIWLSGNALVETALRRARLVGLYGWIIVLRR